MGVKDSMVRELAPQLCVVLCKRGHHRSAGFMRIMQLCLSSVGVTVLLQAVSYAGYDRQCKKWDSCGVEDCETCRIVPPSAMVREVFARVPSMELW